MSAYLRKWASQVHEGKGLDGNSVICNLFLKTVFIRNDHVEQAHSMRGCNVYDIQYVVEKSEANITHKVSRPIVGRRNYNVKHE